MYNLSICRPFVLELIDIVNLFKYSMFLPQTIDYFIVFSSNTSLNT